jgi:hypothetical protein
LGAKSRKLNRNLLVASFTDIGHEMPRHILIQSFARAFENTSRLEEMHRQTKPKTDFLLFVFALEFVSSSDAMIF